jgi:hypothetical protein
MAIDAALEGLYIGADHSVELTVYTSAALTAIQDISGWTIVLDIRKKDSSPTPALLSKTGTVSGTHNSSPGSNTQKCTFTLSDDDLAATVFTGDEFTGRYSIWRTDAGSEQPLRFGDCTITRTTRT